MKVTVTEIWGPGARERKTVTYEKFNLTGRFVVVENGQEVTYTNYDDIPEFFEKVIIFEPEITEENDTSEHYEKCEVAADFLMNRQRKI